MFRKLCIMTAVLAATLCAASCGRKDADSTREPSVADASDVPFVAARFLPDSSSVIRPTDSAVTVLRAEAHEMPGEPAARYLAFGLVGRSTRNYVVSDIEISAQIAQFATSNDAYGLYAASRPDGITTFRLGAEGYVRGNAMHFTQRECVVSLTAEDEREAAADAMRLLAVTISTLIGDSGWVPEAFALFPEADRIIPSDKYYPASFLEIAGLDEVFTSSYVRDGDTLLLFLASDRGGTKYLSLMESVARSGWPSEPAVGFEFDEGYGSVFEHPKYGPVAAGLKSLRLIGAVGYRAEHDQANMRQWSESLQ